MALELVLRERVGVIENVGQLAVPLLDDLEHGHVATATV
jgi:hypothetical protein